MNRLIAVFYALFFLTGCTTYVTVLSEPEGAMISDASGSKLYGYAPVQIEYDTDTLRNQGNIIPGYVATWPSGAKAETEDPFYIPSLRDGCTVKLTRPDDAPGLEKDLSHALQRAQQRAREAEIERDRAYMYMGHWGWQHGWGPGWGIGFGFPMH